MDETLQNILTQISQNKSNQIFLQKIHEYVNKCIKENKYADLDKQLKKIFPNQNVRITNYYSHEQINDSRVSNYYEIEFEKSYITIEFDKYYSRMDGQIYETFYVKNDGLMICELYDELVYKLNTNIKNNNIQIFPHTISIENAFKILNFCLKIN